MDLDAPGVTPAKNPLSRTGDCLKMTEPQPPALRPGMTYQRTITVDEGRAITFMGDDLRVYATPHVVSDLEYACRDFIKKSDRRHAGLVGSRRAMKQVWQLELAELNRITEQWADTALELREQDLKIMNRLVAAQARLADRLAAA